MSTVGMRPSFPWGQNKRHDLHNSTRDTSHHAVCDLHWKTGFY